MVLYEVREVKEKRRRVNYVVIGRRKLQNGITVIASVRYFDVKAQADAYRKMMEGGGSRGS